MKRAVSGALIALTLGLSAQSAFAESATAERSRKEASIPRCVRSLGSLAVKLPPDGTNWWTGESLAAPDTVIKAFGKQSGCFTLVDRGAGLALAEQERSLAAGGRLRANSNIGNGQMRAADYILVPSLLSKNSHASGNGLGGLLAFVPGVGLAAAAVASGISINSKTADVSLSLIDVRSSEEVATEEGHAKKKDMSWGGGVGLAGTTGFGAVGATGYADTEIGQLIMLAYLDAYTRIVTDRGAVLKALPEVAGSNNPEAGGPVAPRPLVAKGGAAPSAGGASMTLIRVSSLHNAASAKSRVLGPLASGAVVYPTGEKSGPWIEVTDEEGHKGWVSSASVTAP